MLKKGDVDLKIVKKFISVVIVINLFSIAIISPIITKAETNNELANNLVVQALSEKNLYYYNLAYKKIIELPDSAEKAVLLSKLATIADKVWTEEVSEIVKDFETMAKEKSGRVYDTLEAKITNSKLADIDKKYLFYELYGWGKDTVWTEDYVNAVNSILKVWKDKTESSSIEAEKAISRLKLQLNKDYLKELLEEAKIAVGLASLVLDEKYFEKLENKVYIGDEKKVEVDLTKASAENTITLKGKYKTLSINAPQATVILEDATVEELVLLDVAQHSLYLKGMSKVEKLVVDDKDDNASVVLQGKSSISAAEVKSGVNIQVNTDEAVELPFGKLSINSTVKKLIELNGDFKASEIYILKPAELKIGAIVKKIIVDKEAVDSILNISKEGKLQELSTEAIVKVEGTGSLEKVTGSASDKIINNISQVTVPPITGGIGGGGGSTTPSYTINNILDSVIASLNDANLNAELRGSDVILSKKADGSIGTISISIQKKVDISVLGIVINGIKSKTEDISMDYDGLKLLADGTNITVIYDGNEYNYTIKFQD